MVAKAVAGGGLGIGLVHVVDEFNYGNEEDEIGE